MTFSYISAFFICYFLNFFYIFMEPYDPVCCYWNNYKTLNIAMFELPQDLKCVEKMVVVTDTDETLLQGIVEITWLYSLD